MSVTITASIEYLGSLRTSATHYPSTQTILNDAPLDNQGKGEAFSPTDMVATALATCILTTIGIFIERGRLPQITMRAEIQKIMSSDPRRIGEIVVALFVGGESLSTEQRDFLESAAHKCPVAKSLHPDIRQTLTFTYTA